MRQSGDAFFDRIAAELEATTKECGVRGCTNQATHTWSGHPTCDDHALPGRKAVPSFPIPMVLRFEDDDAE